MRFAMALEATYDRRPGDLERLVIATIGALLFHVALFIVALLIILLAATYGFFGSSEEEVAKKPKKKSDADVIVTMADPSLFAKTTHNEREKAPPKKSIFESDRNTTEASKLASKDKKGAAVPTQKGIDLPTQDMVDKEFTDGKLNDRDMASKASKQNTPQPPKLDKAQETPSTDPVPPLPVNPRKDLKIASAKMRDPIIGEMEKGSKVLAESKDEKSNLIVPENKTDAPDTTVQTKPKKLGTPARKEDTPESPSTPKPTPMVVRKTDPVPPKPVSKASEALHSPHTRASKKDGSIDRIADANAVAAMETIRGKYMTQVNQLIGRRWNQKKQENADFVEFGNLKVRFYVNKKGKVEGAYFVKSEANSIMQDFTLDSILNAKLPPIPKEIFDLLKKERLQFTYDFIIY